MNRKSNKGFTLVEIMIVVAIIAILAAVAIPNFITYRKTSQMNACIANMKQIQSAAEQCKLAGKVVSVENLYGNDKYIRIEPKCPGDKSKGYTVADGNDGVTVTCANNPGGDYAHVLPDGTSGAAPAAQ